MITFKRDINACPVTVTMTDDETDPATVVVIEFDDLQAELLYSDPEERMEGFKATGTGDDGKNYVASAAFFCDELDSIDDIEEE